MSIHPREAKDLMLAPVAAEVDLNLQTLRTKPVAEIDFELQIQLNQAAVSDDRAERAARVLALALRNVDLHGWDASITDDSSAVRLSGGSVSLDIALSASVERFIAEAPAGQAAERAAVDASA
jgi:hypothetical protein